MQIQKNQKTATARDKVSGFSLIELLVVVGIMGVITAVALVSRPASRSGLETTNVAYDVALFLREAQTYGIGTVGAGANFDVGYGVHINRNTMNQMILFLDADKNKQYDSGSDTILKTFSFPTSVSMNRYCGTLPNGVTKQCANAGSGIPGINITFVRPNPDAQIRRHPTPASFIEAEIVVRHTMGDERFVRVYTTGHISVSDS